MEEAGMCRGRNQAKASSVEGSAVLRGVVKIALTFRTSLVEQRGLAFYRSVLTSLWMCTVLELGRGA